jgi:hypothetical protein
VGPKRPGAFRILVLGDSFTEGAGVEEEEAYPQVLEKILRRRIARAVDVVNAGVGGWDPFQYAQYFERHGLAFEPDLVLVGFFVGNDTYSERLAVETLPTAIGGRRVSRESARRKSIRLAVFLQEHFHLARALRGRAPRFEARRSCDDFSPWFLEAQASRLANHRVRAAGRDARARPNVDQILRIQGLAASRGIPVVVALLPDENQINAALRTRLLAGKDLAAYDFEMPQSMLAALFAGRDVHLVDLLPVFRRDPRCLYMNDMHWTPGGQALAADALAREFLPLIRPVRELAGTR